MSLEAVLGQINSVAGTFDIRLIVLLFVICLVGEFSLSVPYLLETVWLMAGYNLGAGVIAPWEMAVLWLVAQAGRQSGGTTLYFLSRLGSTPLIRLYNRLFGGKVANKLSGKGTGPFGFLRTINYFSPFSIAMGRLFWLRIPLTLTLGIKRAPRTLSVGILLSSLVWDGVYISLGLLGASATLKPLQMVMYSLIGLTALYGLTLIVRHLPRRQPKQTEA